MGLLWTRVGVFGAHVNMSGIDFLGHVDATNIRLGFERWFLSGSYETSWETGLKLQLLIDKRWAQVMKESRGNVLLASEMQHSPTHPVQCVGAVTKGNHTPTQHRTANSHLRFPRLSAGRIPGPSFFAPSPFWNLCKKSFWVLGFFSLKSWLSPGFMKCTTLYSSISHSSIAHSSLHNCCNFSILESTWRGRDSRRPGSSCRSSLMAAWSVPTDGQAMWRAGWYRTHSGRNWVRQEISFFSRETCTCRTKWEFSNSFACYKKKKSCVLYN